MHAIADMIMDGIICKDCGNFIDGDSPGYERNCGCIVGEESNINKDSFIKQIKELFTSKK